MRVKGEVSDGMRSMLLEKPREGSLCSENKHNGPWASIVQ